MRDLFFDRVFRSPRTSPEYREAMSVAELFLIDNIMPALPEKLDVGYNRFVPPYDITWFEWTDWADHNVGVVVVRAPLPDGGWGVFIYPAISDQNGCAADELSVGFCYDLGPDGRSPFPGRIPETIVCGLNRIKGFETVSKEYIQGLKNLVLMPIMFSLSLLHCKNVGAVEIGGPSAQRGGRSTRSHRRRHHVLQVRPMGGGKQVRSIGQLSAESAAMSLHFVRGHFKNYTDEAPLFGRLTGSYWWESHARGDANIGIVTKDYSINPPINDGETL
jgi:hypothetical protein